LNVFINMAADTFGMQVLQELSVATVLLLQDNTIQALYAIGVIQLQPEDAAALWLLTGMSREQWTGLASALNVHLDKVALYHDGGILLSVTTMQNRLRDSGDLLKSSCYELFDVTDTGTVYVVDDGTVAEEEQDCAGQDRAEKKCMGVQDLEKLLLVPEMHLVQQLCPQAWRTMCATGTVHICIQANNCSVVNFGGFAQKLEQGLVCVARRHPASQKLDVVWHVCSDHLLMSLLTGMMELAVPSHTSFVTGVGTIPMARGKKANPEVPSVCGARLRGGQTACNPSSLGCRGAEICCEKGKEAMFAIDA
jgi:hypothetical protein